MSMAELAKLIGQHGLLRTEGYGFEVGVEIVDVKQAYGRTRYVVKPLAGKGSTTVEDYRVTLAGV
jgi:hypothetical protein